ncbi:MAG: ATP-binding protein [Clostridia bacterium]
MFAGNILLNLFEVVVATLFMVFIVEQKGKKLLALVLFVVLGTASLYFYSSLFYGHSTVGVDVLIGRLTLAIIWCIVFRERILVSLTAFLILGTFEVLFASPVIYIAGIYANLGFLSGLPIMVRMMLLVFPAKILEGLVIVYLGEMKVVIRLYDIMIDEKYYRLSGVIFQIFVIAIFSTMLSSGMFSHLQILVSTALLMLFSALVFASALWDTKTKQKIRALESANIAQEKNIEVIEGNILAIRKEKHDFDNHLNAIMGLCSTEDANLSKKIKKYIESITNQRIRVERVSDSGSDYVDALLAIKYQTALQHGIDFSIKFDAKLTGLLAFEKELVAIFGNIIDNAMDALVANKNLDKRLGIYSEIMEQNLVVCISNNGPSIQSNLLDKIFEVNFSTKADGHMNRGFGLPIVAENIAKVGGTVSVASSNDKTIFKVIFLGGAKESNLESRRLL